MSTCVICVEWCEIVSVLLCMCMVMRVQCAWYDMMISDWYIHVWYDLVLYVCYDLIMALYIRILCTLQDWNLYVVLNTACDCIWCYVMRILVLCYVVMCVYVDNYVDNSLIYVDNFFVAFATLLRTFLKILYFRVFSHIISCYLSFTRIISFFHHTTIINYIAYTI